MADKAIQTIARERLPHITFKLLLLPEFGGGIERALGHFRRFESHSDDTVAALAHERVFIISQMARLFTPEVKTTAGKPIPRTILPCALYYIREMLHSLSRSIKEEFFRPDDKSVIFNEEYGSLLKHAIGVCSSASRPHPRKTEPPAATRPAPSVAAPSSAPNPKKRARHQRADTCTNCARGGTPNVKHTLSECQALGNPCRVACYNRDCRGATHWHVECPARKKNT